ncbi:redox-sensing transcriptional repressor [Dethiosulfatibacter aminovorans DSM 17477]|uniref:Redox-sensing transcriptional repressor Rex n=1 Tax=Dethiosulfatibacter aminovorans DSM 17477 TaxID=1121476 RepID=A0A1M6C0P8_9FIRM|nr:redox-sensing transcriptional repressor Rex [Dethiosulfatibacter aminovorans]SHI54605.1 redox-sensing transcriptional repressor [Dethiosulfatibacter aminovorans DSM 17477]
MYSKKISNAVIKRLPRYHRYLGELLENQVTRISSKELGDRMGVTASQIRQDLNNFGGFGQQGYGYKVEYLYNEISQLLGLGKKYNVIVVGAGNLGQALANYLDFEKSGFVIKALFDVNPRLVGLFVRGIEVMDMDNIKVFVKNNNIDIAMLTLPKANASQIAVELVSYGIKGIWNFAPVNLEISDDSVVVENVHLFESLITLAYIIKNEEDPHTDDMYSMEIQ